MRVVNYNSDIHKSQWDDFVQRAKNSHFMFYRDYMEYHKDRFDDCSLLIFDDKNKLIALLPANKKGDTLYSHQGLTYGGFLTTNKVATKDVLDSFDVLKTYLKENGFKKLIYKVIPYIYHKIPAQEDLYALFRNEAKLYRADVSSTVALQEALIYRSSRSRSIKKAQEHKSIIKESNDYKKFFSIVNSRLEEKYKVKATHTAKEMELLSARFPDNIKLFSMEYQGEIVAGALLYLTETVVHAQYVFAKDIARELRMTDVLVDFVIKKYPERKYFNFGNSNEDNGKILNEELISYKESFGARATIQEFYELNL